MNCKRHPSKSAVALCEECGAGICRDCADVTKGIGNLCLDCAQKEIGVMLQINAEGKSMLTRGIIKLAIAWTIGLIVFIVGLALALTNGEGDDKFLGIILIIAGIVISGIFTAAEYWRSIGFKYKNDYQASYLIGKKIANACIGLAFGLLLDPIKIIQNSVEKKKIDEDTAQLIKIRSYFSKL